MHWFKMKTDNLDDPFIYDLMKEYGSNGYLIYFGMISLICRDNGKDCTGKAEFSQAFISQKLKLRWGTIRKVLMFCQSKGKIDLIIEGDNLNLYFPKILEIRDEYSRRVDRKPDNVKVNNRVTKPGADKKKEKEIILCENGKTVRENFELDWGNYPRKKGRKEKAFKSYQDLIGSNSETRKLFLAKIEAQGVEHPDGKFLIGGEKFFENWLNLEFKKEPIESKEFNTPGGGGW